LGPIGIREVWASSDCGGGLTRPNSIDAFVTNVCVKTSNGGSEMFIWDPTEDKFGVNQYNTYQCPQSDNKNFIDYGVIFDSCTAFDNGGVTYSYFVTMVSSPQDLFQRYSSDNFLVEIGYGQVSCIGDPTTFSIVFYNDCVSAGNGYYAKYQFSISGADVTIYSDSACTIEITNILVSNEQMGLNNCLLDTDPSDGDIKKSKMVTTSYYFLSHLYGTQQTSAPLSLIEYNGDRMYSSYVSNIIPTDDFYVCSDLSNCCEQYSDITFADSITNIGGFPWSGCPNVKRVIIPTTVTSISSNGFRMFSSLISIIIPDTLTSIGAWAFSYCYSLGSITIPTSVTSIQSATFHDCISLASIVMPTTIDSIGDWAFAYCTSLTSISIPTSISNIAEHTFDNCQSLTNVVIPDSVLSIGDEKTIILQYQQLILQINIIR